MVHLSGMHFRSASLAMTLAAALTLGTSLAQLVHTVRHAGDDKMHSLNTPVMPVAAEHLPDIRMVARSGWFGVPPQERGVAGIAQNQNLATRFELMGVSRSDDKALAGAFIAEKNQAEHYYRIGDDLPDGAGKLDAVFPDRITVRQGEATNELPFSSSFTQKSN